MIDNEISGKKIDDGCPKWAHDQLLKLRAIEVQMGHIPAHGDFHRVNIDETMLAILENEGESLFNNGFTEVLFAKIVKSLQYDGHSIDSIVRFINNRIGYTGGPPYCNAEEVQEAISGQ